MRELRATLLDAFVASGAGGLNTPKDIVFGADGYLYVTSKETDQILKYEGPHGASPGSFVGVFANTGAGSTPNNLTFGPDGNLFVGLPSFNTPTPYDVRIDRFNGSTGALIDTFVPTDSGGLKDSREILFDEHGNMYVAADYQSAVLRYQGPSDQTPGAFIDEFVPPGLGGLNKPMGMLFDANGNLLVGSRDSDNVLRYGAASQAVFTVTLTHLPPHRLRLTTQRSAVLHWLAQTTSHRAVRSRSRPARRRGPYWFRPWMTSRESRLKCSQ